MATYEVTILVEFAVRSVPYSACCSLMLPFVPFVGLHIGPSQFVTICQVHWCGSNRFICHARWLDTQDMSLEEVGRALAAGAVGAEPFLGWSISNNDEAS